MKLIKINNNNVELAEGVLLVPEFKEIWENNSKEKSLKIFTYIYLFADYDSVYKNYDEEDRKIVLKRDLKIDFTEDLNKAIEKYKEMNYTFYMKFADDALHAANKTREYFRGVDYSKVDVKGNLLYKGTDVTKMLKDVMGIITSLEAAREKAKTEQLVKNKVKAGAVISKWEK